MELSTLYLLFQDAELPSLYTYLRNSALRGGHQTAKALVPWQSNNISVALILSHQVCTTLVMLLKSCLLGYGVSSAFGGAPGYLTQSGFRYLAREVGKRHLRKPLVSG